MAAVSFKPPSQQQSPLPHLRVCTLNILAPCYNYLESGFAPESRDKNRYLQRNTSIIDMLEEQKADVLCLQEFWPGPGMWDLYSKAFSAYTGGFMCRTGSKKAIFISKTIKIEDEVQVRFRDQGDRVALIMVLQLPQGERVLVCNTQLTYSHNQYDQSALRLEQIKKVTASITDYLKKRQNVPFAGVLLVGDFNTHPGQDFVYPFLTENNWVSTYAAVHGSEARVTHLTHNGEQVAADFIWLATSPLLQLSQNAGTSELVPSESVLYPANISEERFPKEYFTFIDHRPLITSFFVSRVEPATPYTTLPSLRTQAPQSSSQSHTSMPQYTAQPQQPQPQPQLQPQSPPQTHQQPQPQPQSPLQTHQQPGQVQSQLPAQQPVQVPVQSQAQLQYQPQVQIQTSQQAQSGSVTLKPLPSLAQPGRNSPTLLVDRGLSPTSPTSPSSPV